MGCGLNTAAGGTDTVLPLTTNYILYSSFIKTVLKGQITLARQQVSLQIILYWIFFLVTKVSNWQEYFKKIVLQVMDKENKIKKTHNYFLEPFQ